MATAAHVRRTAKPVHGDRARGLCTTLKMAVPAWAGKYFPTASFHDDGRKVLTSGIDEQESDEGSDRAGGAADDGAETDAEDADSGEVERAADDGPQHARSR